MADKDPSTDPAQLLRSFLSQNEAAIDPNTSRSHYIDFGSKGGERHGLKYLDLKWIKLVPSGILDLHFATHHVEIRE